MMWMRSLISVAVIVVVSLLNGQWSTTEASAQELVIHHFSYGYNSRGMPLIEVTLFNPSNQEQNSAVEVKLIKPESTSQNSYEEEQVDAAQRSKWLRILPHKSVVVSMYTDHYLEAGDYQGVIKLLSTYDQPATSFDFSVAAHDIEQARLNSKNHLISSDGSHTSANWIWKAFGLLTFFSLLIIIGVICFHAVKGSRGKNG